MQKFFFLIFSMTVFAACKKKGNDTPHKPYACFNVEIWERLQSNPTIKSITSVDSNFYFRNCSESGGNITYSWNFGDGTTSTERFPQHSYSKRGIYTVTLIVSNNNQAFDTVQEKVTVFLGQRYLSSGEGVNVLPLAIEENSANDFILLASTNTSEKYRLYQLDSMMKPTSMKVFPSSYNLTSMSSTGDANYIFTGSTTDPAKSNELLKMKDDGSLLWHKPLSINEVYKYSTSTPDGGYVVVGKKNDIGALNNLVVVRKTDHSGNEQWNKLFNQEEMFQCGNVIVEQDGYVLAGTKYASVGAGSGNDSLMIVKLNHSGETVWKNTVPWGLNTLVLWDTYICKISNGNYVINNENGNGVLFFSDIGAFLFRKLVLSQVRSVIPSQNGNLIVLQKDVNNGTKIRVTQLGIDGSVKWEFNPDGWQKISNTLFNCCADSYPVVTHQLRKGGILVTGYRSAKPSTGGADYFVGLFFQLNDIGGIK